MGGTTKRRDILPPDLAIKKWYGSVPRPSRIAFFSAVLLTLLIHLSAYVQPLFSHDSIWVYQDQVGNWSDRYFAYLIYHLYDGLQVSWPLGLITAVFLGGSVALITEILGIKKTVSVVMLAGFVVAFPTVISFNCHLFAAPAFSFAMLCSVAAVFALERNKRGWLWAIPLLILCCFTYSAYLCLAAGLMLLSLIRRTFRESESAKEIFLRGLLYFGVLAVSAGIYYLIWQFGNSLTGTVVSSYRNKDQTGLVSLRSLASEILSAYRSVVRFFLLPGQESYYTKTAFAVFWPGLAAAVCLVGILFGKMPVKSAAKRLIAIACVALMPLAMDAMYVLNNDGGEPHLLMRFAYVLPWIVMVKVFDAAIVRLPSLMTKRRLVVACTWCILIMSAVTIYKDALIANETYLKLKLNYDASVSTATRLIDRIETEEGYTQETEVVFVGVLACSETREGFKHTLDIAGAWMTRSFTTTEYLKSFIRNQLGTDMNITVDDGTYEEREDVQALESFPSLDCMLWDGDVLIVKVGGSVDEYLGTVLSSVY